MFGVGMVVGVVLVMVVMLLLSDAASHLINPGYGAIQGILGR